MLLMNTKWTVHILFYEMSHCEAFGQCHHFHLRNLKNVAKCTYFLCLAQQII